MAQSGLQVGRAQICDKVRAEELLANGGGPAKRGQVEIYSCRDFAGQMVDFAVFFCCSGRLGRVINAQFGILQRRLAWILFRVWEDEQRAGLAAA